MSFPFQKLTVYQKTLDWIDEMETLLDLPLKPNSKLDELGKMLTGLVKSVDAIGA